MIVRHTSYHVCVEEIRKNSGTLYYSGSGKKIQTLLEESMTNGVKTVEVTEDELNHLCGGKKQKGFCFETKISDNNRRSLSVCLSAVPSPDFVLLLDGITDPQNVGAIVRSADQFGVDFVVVPRSGGGGGMETVARVSAGASSWIPIIHENLDSALRKLKEAGFWIYAADMGGETLRDFVFERPVALILGSEGAGVSKLLRERCDGIVSIPTEGHIDSLNVSAAAAIFLYEINAPRSKLH